MKPDELLAELESFRLSPAPDLFTAQATEMEAPAAAVEDFGFEDPSGTRKSVPRITNELWAASQRQGHSLHEISYRACFKAELPRFFLTRLSKAGDSVLDPFMGRGTTLLEAALLGRVPVGNDLNPLSKILLTPRIEPPLLADVDERLDLLRERIVPLEAEDDEPDLEPFYEEETLGELRALRRYFLDGEAHGTLDAVDRWLRMVATNRLTGHSSGFFSGRTMPPNQAVTPVTQRKLNERLALVPPRRDLFRILNKKTRSLLRNVTDADRYRLAQLRDKARLLTGQASCLDALETASIACTVTSPPFLDIVQYATDNWLRCWFNGIDAQAVEASIRDTRKLEAWRDAMGEVFVELFRVTRPGGWVVFEVGELRKGKLRLEEEVLPVASAAGFDTVGVVVHSQEFTKTANCWGVSNNKGGTNTNRLVLLQKPGAAR